MTLLGVGCEKTALSRREQPGFVSSLVLAEITWVLSRAYKSSREDIAHAVEGLFRSVDLVVENSSVAYRPLGVFQFSKSAGFADALIAETASLAGPVETVTFDQRTASSLGMRLQR